MAVVESHWVAEVAEVQAAGVVSSSVAVPPFHLLMMKRNPVPYPVKVRSGGNKKSICSYFPDTCVTFTHKM